MKNCFACGMPLVKKEDYAMNDKSSNFCIHCVNGEGKVKSAEEIFKGGVEFFLSKVGDDKVLAERLTRKNMKGLSYWDDKAGEVLEGDIATDEEFNEVLKKLA